jgi:hypothetical protein
MSTGAASAADFADTSLTGAALAGAGFAGGGIFAASGAAAGRRTQAEMATMVTVWAMRLI